MTTPKEPAVHIGWDDLYAPETERYVETLQAAQAAPLVREVGDAGDKAAWYRGHLVQMTLAGLIGGLVAWGLVELVPSPEASADGDATAANILFTMMIGFGIGIVLALWEGIAVRSIRKVGLNLAVAVPVLGVVTLIGGVIANAIYEPWISSVVERLISRGQTLDWTEAQFYDAFSSAAHLPRGVAWSIVGLAAGIGVGLSSRKLQRVLNGALGGLIGGFLGGVVFDFFPSGVFARAVGIALTGVAIGLGIGLVERARRQHWLEIVAGGMTGKQFILYSNRTTIGAGADNDVTLIKDPAIRVRHCVLSANDRGIFATAEVGAAVLVNGAPVATQHLNDGDMLQLGSTMLRYRDKAEQSVVSGAILG